jgi:hypothetical protein
MDPADFLKIISIGEQQQSPFKIATIPGSYTSGRPTLLFDGESSATVRTWPYLSVYSPAANDRVLVAMAGHSGVVLGKII